MRTNGFLASYPQYLGCGLGPERSWLFEEFAFLAFDGGLVESSFLFNWIAIVFIANEPTGPPQPPPPPPDASGISDCCNH